MANQPSILSAAAAITGWSNDDLAVILGISASTCQSYRTGRRTEYLSGKQRKALLDCVRLWVDQNIAAYEALTRM